jgi:2-polyprenyl-3-methyl-5-hydroxy-6-metoxy-1,4-benzoquinol methylase
MNRLKNIRPWKNFMLDRDYWFSKICESYTNPPQFHNDEKLPAFPSDELQVNTTGQSGVETLREAFVFYQDCVTTLAEIGAPLTREQKVLDFGVGWGRIARFFMESVPKEGIYGIDVTDDFVKVCRDTFGNKNFYTCEPFPPTDLPHHKFNLITGYSVFSHLSEDACKNWMDEFHRILMPGGVVALTTRGRPFFDYCESLQRKGHEGYQGALSRMFSSFDDARKSYDAGEFVHSNSNGVTGGGDMDGSFYGESFIPEAYAKSAYLEKFVMIKFLFDPARQTHPIMFFRKL